MGLLQGLGRPKYRGEPEVWACLAAVLLSFVVGFQAVTNPEGVEGISLGILEMSALALILYHREKKRPDGAWWIQLILVGLLVRLVFAFVHVEVGLGFYRGQVDFVGAQGTGQIVGRKLRETPLRWLTDGVWEGEFLEIYHQLLGLQYLAVGPTLTGDNLIGMFLVSALAGFVGGYLFVRAFDVFFPTNRERRFLGLSLFLIPSIAYWTSLLGKDSLMFLFMGWISYAFARLLAGFRIRYVVEIAISLAIVTSLRAPVGAVVALALGCAWWLSWRPKGPAGLLRPIALILVAAGIAGVVIGISVQYLREYDDVLGPFALQSILDLAVVKHVGLATDPTAGGSSLSAAVTRPSIREFYRFLPEGMFTFLFRPLVFEAHHALALAAALDGTFLLALVVWRRRNLVAAVRSTFRTPFIGFCWIIFILLTAMLGFERNLGVIVRHRSMVLPFLMILLAVPPTVRTNGRSPLKGTGGPA